ncbi:MAG: nucleotide exchange factor GrpE [Desulfobacterales bacterium]|nr:nucleotide exchange factor GrpE [Desulfobacterales bacterium]
MNENETHQLNPNSINDTQGEAKKINEETANEVDSKQMNLDCSATINEEHVYTIPNESPSFDAILTHFFTLSQQINQLHDVIYEKITKDSFKEKLIDKLHQELEQYKSDAVKKQFQSTIGDFIKIIDDIKKLVNYYKNLSVSEIDPSKILNQLERLPQDIEDILSFQGIEVFTIDAPFFDPSKQRILKKIKTTDPSMDKKIAESVYPGYQWDEKIIRPEIVSVYLYTETI